MAAEKNMAYDGSGNMNLDFLAGLLIFMLTFLYVINTIPGIFLPYQTSSVDLGSVIYRTTNILAEDPGWYSNLDEGMNGTQWEQHNVTYLKRIGLAYQSKWHPNELDINKINALSNVPYDTVREKLGLGNITDTDTRMIVYNFSLLVREMNESEAPGHYHEILNISNPGSEWASSAESLERIVSINKGDMILIDCSSHTGTAVSALNLNGTNISALRGFNEAKNITVRLTNFSSPLGPPADLYCIYVNYSKTDNYDDGEIADFYNNEYFIRIKNDTHECWLTSLDDYYPDANYENNNFTIDIVINGTQIWANHFDEWNETEEGSPEPLFNPVNNLLRLQIKTANETFVYPYFSDLPYVDYSGADSGNPYYKYIFNKGTMTLKVWKI